MGSEVPSWNQTKLICCRTVKQSGNKTVKRPSGFWILNSLAMPADLIKIRKITWKWFHWISLDFVEWNDSDDWTEKRICCSVCEGAGLGGVKSKTTNHTIFVVNHCESQLVIHASDFYSSQQVESAPFLRSFSGICQTLRWLLMNEVNSSILFVSISCFRETLQRRNILNALAPLKLVAKLSSKREPLIRKI